MTGEFALNAAKSFLEGNNIAGVYWAFATIASASLVGEKAVNVVHSLRRNRRGH